MPPEEDMNIKKGIDRIALVLAIIAIVPGFIAGWKVYKEKRTTSLKISAKDFLENKFPIPPSKFILESVYKPLPEFKVFREWHKEGPEFQALSPYRKAKIYSNFFDDKMADDDELLKTWRRSMFVKSGKVFKEKSTLEELEKAYQEGERTKRFFLSTQVIEEHKYVPPKWQCAIVAFVGSGIAFLIVLFSIGGITRVLLWIVGGFKSSH